MLCVLISITCLILYSHSFHFSQRAFSDAHRALVASLEWDMNLNDLNDEDDFPLLKSLLQNEDIFFESESHLSVQPN